MTSPSPAGITPHTLTEDTVAVFTGVLLISVGVAFFTSAGLLTGGTAGLAFLLHYATGIGFGKIFLCSTCRFIGWRCASSDVNSRSRPLRPCCCCRF